MLGGVLLKIGSEATRNETGVRAIGRSQCPQRETIMGHLKTTLAVPSDRQSTSALCGKKYIHVVLMVIAVYKNVSEFSPQAVLSWLYSGTIFFGKETSFPVSPKPLTPHNTVI